MTEISRGRLIVLFLTLTGFAFSAYAVPPLILVMSESFGVRFENFGYLFLIQYACFALASYTGSRVGGLLKLRKGHLVIIGLAGCSATMVAAPFIRSFPGLLAWAAPLGYFGGLVETFTSVLVTEFERRKSGRLINLSQVFFCLGALAAPQIIALFLYLKLGWVASFLILASCIACVNLLFYFFLVRKKLDVTAADRPDETAAELPAKGKNGVFLFLAAGAAMFSYVVVEIGSASWVAAFFERVYGLTTERAAGALSVFWLGLLIGRSLMVVLPSRYTLWPALITGSLLMAGASLSVFISRSASLGFFFLLIFGMGAGPIWPSVVMLSKMVSRSDHFTAGVIGLGAIGAAVGPYIVSSLIRVFAIDGLFLYFLAGCAFMLIFALVFRAACLYRGRLGRT